MKQYSYLVLFGLCLLGQSCSDNPDQKAVNKDSTSGVAVAAKKPGNQTKKDQTRLKEIIDSIESAHKKRNEEVAVEKELSKIAAEEKAKELSKNKGAVQKSKPRLNVKKDDEVKAVAVNKSSKKKSSVSTKAKPRPKKTMAAVAQFEKIVHSFDTIVSGDVVEHNFVFQNRGNLDLVVNGTDVSCGCTVPSYPFIPVKPGSDGFIGVRYSSAGKSGDQEATVTVKTNAKPQIYELKMVGYVKEPPKSKKKSTDEG